jgi:4-hydroxybenzoate polyprenyltransferase
MKKYLIYLNERFPLQTHIPIIGIFTFSAICYSLSAVDATAFISIKQYLLASYLTFSIFLLLRISDEFKDHEDDKKYRKYLPVIRGLISLKELRSVGFGLLVTHVIILSLFPAFIPIYVITMLYMTFMFKEFFVHEWLKKNQVAYVFSHMAIIPLVDLVASSAHWSFEGIDPPRALGWFFAVSFFNGILLEIGRKIKMPENEEEGVVSYSKMYGTSNAVKIWLVVLVATLTLAFFAARAIDSPMWVYILLCVFAVACGVFGFIFLKNPSQKAAKMVENAAGIWTMGMYLNLGALPFLIENVFN